MATTAPQFVLPDISQPSCSSITSWGRACWRPMRGCPSWTSMSSAHSLPSPAETTSSDSGASSTAEGPSSEQQSEQEPEFLSEDEEFDEGSKGDEVEDEGQEDEEGHDEEEAVDADWTRKIAPMNDDELEYVEWAHLHSRFLDVYCEPSLRFFVNPPVTFAMPKIRSKESQRGGGSPVLPVSIAAAVAAASNKQRNADYSLNAAKTQPPSPPPTTPVDNKGQFEVSKMDVLSEQIWHYHNSITQTEAMLQRKLHLRDMLYYAISPIFPMCGLYVVGSSLNGFGNNSSDMDLCLMITNKDLDQKTDAVVVLNMILSALAKLEWVSNQQLILAKVPILRIKFTSPWQDITVDLNANNSVAIKNTHLLCYYSSFDWRVRPLVSVVKEWAKRKGINDANRSSFTSYSLVLMVIHYLQCGADPSVLPSLQVMFPKRFNTRADVRTLNVTQPLQHPVEEWHYTDKTTLGELFIGFLDYYANKFDYDRDAISVRQGRRVDRAVLARHRPNGVAHGNHWRSQWRCICIEEPFTQSNTAHSIYDEMVFDAIKTAFRDAHDELEKNRDLQSLLNCKPISVSLPHNGAVVYAFDNSSAAATDSSAIPSPTQDLMCSSSANSLNTAMTRSSSSANSMNDGEEIEKEPQPERPRRKSAGSRRHHSNQHHHRKVSSNTAAAPALVASS